MPEPPRKYKPYRASKTHLLDLRRGEEKVAVHLGGDASRLLSINRGCLLFDTEEQISAVSARLENGTVESFGEVVAVVNRFAQPAATGYRDLQAFIRDKSTGFISTLRVVHVGVEDAAVDKAAPHAWEMRAIATRAAIGATALNAPVVLISDNYLRDDEDSLTAVHGFLNDTDAWTYAVSRFKDGIRVLANEAISTQDLRYSWLVYGEDVAVLSDDRLRYLGPHLMEYVLQLRISDLPYWVIESDLGLLKTAVPVVDLGNRDPGS